MSEIIDPEHSTLDPKLKSLLNTEQPDEEHFIYCAVCSHVITSHRYRIEVNGHHDHRLTNPHGFEFLLGCFAEALGCDISGIGEAADSWFMSFVWQIASCAECHSHLGWYFSKPASSDYFYGLILTAIQADT